MSDTGTDTDIGTWRGIDELAGLVGAYCWVDRRIFALTGRWASEPSVTGVGGAELTVWCAATSRRHGEGAERWAARLPVRAGVDGSGLVAAPAGPLEEAFEALAAEPGPAAGAAVLVETVLPRLSRVYEAHLAAATPVSEAPVMEVLAQAHRELAGEIRDGRTALGGFPEVRAPEASTGEGRLGHVVERAFDETGIFPAVRAS